MKNPGEKQERTRTVYPQGGWNRAKAPKIFFEIFFEKKFFPGSYYRVAGGVRFTTFLKENFEILSAMEDYRRKVFVIESIGEFQKEILEGKFIGWEEIFVICFYGIIYLKFGAGKKRKKFFEFF